MKKDMPVTHIADIPDMTNTHLDDFFGFALAKIECTDKVKVPILPHRTDDGRIIYPRGV